ncbi:polysaccharide deacetylase family protein [Rhizorhapis sp. SPR117]|uniref:polysaccharide deacetylase family protein n=1 Tax=Rhizorhapis sp. SPR117 TaxID=2912611 RepID=UPI001F3EEF99|nr:polysaccharide deacetylase family protein [Rhizorhapis sp. SPR117]
MRTDTHDGAFNRYPDQRDVIALAPEFGVRFTLFIDTEEEFDWGKPFSRTDHTVNSLRGLAEGQSYLTRSGVRPVHMVDYPILESPAAVELLRAWLAAGECDVGAQLHPWVNPPHEEQVTAANSYVGSLPEELERAKICALRDRITAELSKPPVSFRAGRYGVGPNSARLLEEEGFLLDSSVRALFDYRDQLGPNFYHLPLVPYWAGPERRLVELPLSTTFTGYLRGLGRPLYSFARKFGPLPGGLSKLGMLTRVALTPEGIPVGNALEAIDKMLDDGVRVLNLSFHSPSLEPGHTPYVRDAADLRAFYGWWDAVLNRMTLRGVQAASLDEFLAAVPPPEFRIKACKDKQRSAIGRPSTGGGL